MDNALLFDQRVYELCAYLCISIKHPVLDKLKSHLVLKGASARCGLFSLRLIASTGWWQKWLGARQHVGYMAQGEQRTLDSTGRVIPAKLPSQHIQVSPILPLSNRTHSRAHTHL